MPKSVAGTPADPTVHWTTVQLNGTSYKLAFDFNAVAEAEEMTGQSLLIGVKWDKLSLRTLSAMAWASMRKAHPETTLEQVRKMIVPRTAPEVASAIVVVHFDADALHSE